MSPLGQHLGIFPYKYTRPRYKEHLQSYLYRALLSVKARLLRPAPHFTSLFGMRVTFDFKPLSYNFGLNFAKSITVQSSLMSIKGHSALVVAQMRTRTIRNVLTYLSHNKVKYTLANSLSLGGLNLLTEKFATFVLVLIKLCHQ